jgi:hypothetical protein
MAEKGSIVTRQSLISRQNDENILRVVSDSTNTPGSKRILIDGTIDSEDGQSGFY